MSFSCCPMWSVVTDGGTPDTHLRRHISEPYNFQHLTHTHANQFQTLQKTSHSELVSEFSAIRASQVPCRDLRGIKAESLQPSTSQDVTPDVKSASSSPVHSRHVSSPPLSPLSPRRPETRYGSQGSGGSIPYPRAVENFSQPSPKSYKPRPSPITPPPRMSSKHTGSEHASGNHASPGSPLFHRHHAGNATVDFSALSNISTPPTTLEWENDLFDYSTTPHAVSTPDGTALTLKPLPFGNLEKDLPGLPEEAGEEAVEKVAEEVAEKVAEEGAEEVAQEAAVEDAQEAAEEVAQEVAEEVAQEVAEEVAQEVAEDVATETINVPSSPSPTLRPNLRHAKSFPSTKSLSRRWSRTSPRVSPDGLISPLVDGPPLAEAVIPSVDHPLDDIPFRPRLSRQISTALAKFDECWEDDIDYCYEHAAEADCDFDWDRDSSEDKQKDGPNKITNLDVESTSSHDTLYQASNNICTPSNDRERPTGRPSPFDLPPLQSSRIESSSSRDSSKSSTLSINGPATPSQSLLSPIALHLPFKETKDSAISPVFIPRDFESQLIQEDVYQRLLAGDHVAEQIYSFHDGNSETSSKGNSPRSSHSRISKNPSQESFSCARPASIRHYRDNESVGSLPELVYSRRNARVNDLMSVCAPRSQPEKPLPRRPNLGENHRQETIRPSMIQSSMMWNQSPNTLDDPILPASPPQVPPKVRRERNPSRAVGNWNEFASPPGFATPSRRIGSSKITSTQATQPPSTNQSAPVVFLSVPF